MVISVRVPESGVYVDISGEDCLWYVCDVLNAVLYVRVSCCVVRGCARGSGIVPSADEWDERSWWSI